MATTVASVTTEELFNAAVDVIRDLPKNGSFQPSNQLMLRFYGFYKQATEGPCHNAKPAFWDVVGRAKWGAWNKLGTMPKEEAMKLYIEELKKIVETMAYTENIDRFMEVLEPFYEFLDIGDKSSDPEAIPNGRDYRVAIKVAANGEPNGDSTTVEAIKSIQNGHPVHLTKESLSEKYFSDSDSENEEYVDPVEAHIDDIKLLKQGLLDHNDNDSGYADHVTYSLNRDAQNGSDHGLLASNQNPLWSLYSNEKSNDTVDTPSPHHIEHNGNEFINGDNDFLIQEKLLPGSNGEGLVARGGGDENGASGSGPIGQRRGHSSDVRNQGHRDNITQPQMGLLPRRVLAAGVGGGGRGGPGRGMTAQNPDDISEQIAMALLRLQRDMDSVLARLNVLETVALAQHNTAQDRLMAQLNMQSSQVQLLNNSSTPSWWPFKELSCRTFFFFLTWPIFLHFLIRFIASRRARRHMRKL